MLYEFEKDVPARPDAGIDTGLSKTPRRSVPPAISPEDFLELQIIAQQIAGDLGLEVTIGAPGAGSFFSFHPPRITLDPAYVLRDPDDAKFVAGHEGAHRRFSISPLELFPTQTEMETTYGKPGFHATMNTLEDCAVNDGMSREVPGMADYVTKAYAKAEKEGLHVSTPEIEAIVQQIGREPKFAEALAEMTRDWHRWRKELGYKQPFENVARDGRYSTKLDQSVVKALRNTRRAVRKAVSIMPVSGQRDHDTIKSFAEKRLDIVRREVYPEIERLLKEDIDLEAMRQGLQQDSDDAGGAKSGAGKSSMAKGLSKSAQQDLEAAANEFMKEQAAKAAAEFQELKENLSREQERQEQLRDELNEKQSKADATNSADGGDRDAAESRNEQDGEEAEGGKKGSSKGKKNTSAGAKSSKSQAASDSGTDTQQDGAEADSGDASRPGGKKSSSSAKSSKSSGSAGDAASPKEDGPDSDAEDSAGDNASPGAKSSASSSAAGASSGAESEGGDSADASPSPASSGKKGKSTPASSSSGSTSSSEAPDAAAAPSSSGGRGSGSPSKSGAPSKTPESAEGKSLEELQRELAASKIREADLRKELGKRFPGVEQPDETSPAEALGELERQLREKLEAELEKAGETPLPFDKISRNTLRELEEAFDKLSDAEQQKLREDAQKKLEELEHELVEAMRSKLDDSPIETAHAKRLREEQAALQQQQFDDRLEDLAKLQDQLEALRKADRAPFDAVYEDIAGEVQESTNRLQRVLIPRAFFDWHKDQPSGTRINLQRALQAEADPRYLTKLFERRLNPTKRTHAFEILVDTSSSMAGEKMNCTFEGVVFLASLCESLGVQFEVLEFNDNTSLLKEWGDSIKEDSVRRKIAHTAQASNNGTNDAAALRRAYRRLEEKDTIYKFILVLTDAESGVGPDLQSILSKIQSDENTVVVHFGIGKGTADTNGYYRHSYGNLSPRGFFKKFCEVVEDIILDPESYLSGKAA